jgi:hypothetical protein
MKILELQEALISLAAMSEQLMVGTPDQMILRITTGMPPLDQVVHPTGGTKMTIMIVNMIVAIAVQVWLRVTRGNRVTTLMTRMTRHPQMIPTDHHDLVGKKIQDLTHHLEGKIGIDKDGNPIAVIGLDPMTIGVTMGDTPMVVEIVVPLLRRACQGTEIGEVRDIEVKMTFGHLDIGHTQCECTGVRERDQFPLKHHLIMSGVMATTLMRINTRQSYCVVIRTLFMIT